jgi:TusE/DsrC/DsvC family sulfur relay protein
VKYSWAAVANKERQASEAKTYQVDLRGFLVDPSSWDRDFAAFRAEDMGIPGGLTPKHWQIINYLRERFAEKKAIPTVFQAGEDNHLELEELELLFPAGYHRGAVKLSGLRER